MKVLTSPDGGRLTVNQDYIMVSYKDTTPLKCDVRKHQTIHPRCYGKVYRALFLDSSGNVEISTYCLGEIEQWDENYEIIMIWKEGKWVKLPPQKKPKRGKKR